MVFILPKKFLNQSNGNLEAYSIKSVNMRCIEQESCTSLFVKDMLERSIADLKGKTIDEVRKIQDQIGSKILTFIKKLEDDL